MRHLHLVHESEHAPPPPGATPPQQLRLQLAGLAEDPAPPPAEGGDAPELDLVMEAMFGQLDLLLDGLTPEEQLEVARTLYFDADGMPQARSLRLRLA